MPAIIMVIIQQTMLIGIGMIAYVARIRALPQTLSCGTAADVDAPRCWAARWFTD